jgi:outer membrane protein assembly factor BamB
MHRMTLCVIAGGALLATACTLEPSGPGKAPPGRLRWVVELPNGDRGSSGLTRSLVTESLAVITVDSFAYGLDPSSGRLRWQLKDGRFRVHIGEFFDRGDHIIGLFSPNVVAVSSDSGRLLWARAPLPIGVAGAYSRSGDDAFLIGGDFLGFRVSLQDGTAQSIPVRRVADTLTRAFNFLAVGDTLYSRLYSENPRNSLLGQLWLGRFDRATGRAFPPLRFPTDSIAPNSTIEIIDDHAFISDADRNEVWAWNRFTGVARKIHDVRGGFGNMYPVAVSGDTLVVPAADLKMYVYSISTGQRLFTVPTRSSLSSVAICGDVIYMQHSYIEAVSRATGRSIGIVHEPYSARLAALSKGPGYVLGWSPFQAFALECKP